MSQDILQITPAVLRQPLLADWIYPDLAHDLYWSATWDPTFYIALAQAGFISICHEFEPEGCLLLPQLQKAYAVLEWNDLRPARAVRRLVRSGALQASRAALVLTTGTAEVVEGIVRAYGADCWVHPPYRDLLRRLEPRRSDGFRLFAVELRCDGDVLVGGELGYTIGATYTSLTGFVARGDRRWADYGTVQLHALAALLRSHGYAFWNLGHPGMPYKLALGARVQPRDAFLMRWLPACAQVPTIALEAALNARVSCAALLAGATP
jgi:Leucyl/phenylalanyl-tRNA protein transferase